MTTGPSAGATWSKSASAREIREGPKADERQPMMRAGGLRDRLRCVVRLPPSGVVGDPVAESLIAVRFASGVRGSAQRRCRTGRDRRVDAHAPCDLSRVPRGPRDIGVPMTGRDPDDLERRESRGQGERDGVVDARVGVDQNG